LVALTVNNPDGFLARLRRADPPVVARIENDRVVIDLRTVMNCEALLRIMRRLAS
jgi:L-seryl-tRNA(Ser) seleniumtransferase